VAKRRFGVDLPYDQQVVWEIERLKPEQLKVCVEETHTAELVLAAAPYPGAVETVERWHDEGHFIHITSHRATHTFEHTERWLRQIGLPFDELYCSYDKVARCTEIGIDVLIDDSPVNLANAIDHGIRAATIIHPWNQELVETEDVIAAKDWPHLARELAPVLA
jgi:uncharacterized HAD superfamily protein